MNGVANMNNGSKSKDQNKQKPKYENKHKTAEDKRVDGPNRPAE